MHSSLDPVTLQQGAPLRHAAQPGTRSLPPARVRHCCRLAGCASLDCLAARLSQVHKPGAPGRGPQHITVQLRHWRLARWQARAPRRSRTARYAPAAADASTNCEPLVLKLSVTRCPSKAARRLGAVHRRGAWFHIASLAPAADRPPEQRRPVRSRGRQAASFCILFRPAEPPSGWPLPFRRLRRVPSVAVYPAPFSREAYMRAWPLPPPTPTLVALPRLCTARAIARALHQRLQGPRRAAKRLAPPPGTPRPLQPRSPSLAAMKAATILLVVAFAGVALASSNGRDLQQFPTIYADSPKSLPNVATPTVKFAYKDGVGAFQGWNGGVELPKVIDLGGVRVTRPILRGRKLQQFPTIYADSPKSLPNVATPTVKFAYKDGVGAFQGWNGGVELPKVIDLGGVRVTRPILRGRKLQQFPTIYADSPKSLPNVATPTVKFAYKDGVGAFQGWNGGVELPKVIDLGGVRVTRPILRGKH